VKGDCTGGCLLTDTALPDVTSWQSGSLRPWPQPYGHTDRIFGRTLHNERALRT